MKSQRSRIFRRAVLIVAAFGISVVTLYVQPGFFQPRSAHAAVTSFAGVNWADARDNYNSGWVIPTGLSASDSYATVQAKANKILAGFQNNLGANTVRLPINPPSVAQSWWGSYTAAIDTALNRSMRVILGYWTASSSQGTVSNLSDFWTMWRTVINKYGGNGNVYFEIMNEPYGYSATSWTNLVAQWLSTFSNVPRGRVVVSGTGYNDHLSAVGSDSRLNGCLLSLHIYPYWNTSYTTENQWKQDFINRLAGYSSRAIVDEFGAPMTTGINYNVGENHINGNYDVAFMYGVPNQIRAFGMGAVYWPGLRGGDTYTMEQLNGSGTNISLSNTNASGVVQLRWAWGH
ncbi:MAG TPA: cellulase family glycosylhydrolase [Ktedonosporobacter sp.]|nr:cellulase family glycosylhydrolase [Ktedonosporobacter sp.]